jgi:transposase
MDSCLKKRTATKNKIHGEDVLGIPSKYVYRSLKRIKKYLDKEILGIEKKLLSLVKQEQQVQLTLLTSIPGIGIKTALFLIVITDGFDKFENAKQLCSYAGITPIILESGSSVRGRAIISKVRNRKLRNLLFMCSMSAYKCNKSCK